MHTSSDYRVKLLIVWNGVKMRHPKVNVREEWEKYTLWMKESKRSVPEPSTTSILVFESNWLKNPTTLRIKAPLKIEEKIIPEQTIQEAYDIFIMRKLQVTREDVKNLLIEGATLAAIEIWFSTGLFPRSPLLRQFLTLKGIR
jgi:hypothetical protein